MADKRKLDTDILKQRLDDLKNHQIGLNRVDLYGGEISLLKTEYLEKICYILKTHGIQDINLITNLSSIHPFFLKNEIYITVSYDFEAREKHEQVFQNMCKLEKPFSVLVLASPEVIKMNADTMITFFNSVTNLKSVEIKPYSTNQSNQFHLEFSEFEEFIKKWIKSKVTKRFKFVNEDLILDSLDRLKNAFSDDHLYLTPNGNWAVLDFDKHNHEYFRELKNLTEYQEWASLEKLKVFQNGFCSKCNYLGSCLTEHYREVSSIEYSCNGFKNLLDWADLHYGSKQEKSPNTTSL